MDSFGRDAFLAALKMQTRYALIRAFALIPDVSIGLDGAGKDAEVGHLADKWIGGCLPDVSGEGFSIRWLQGLFAIPALCHTCMSVQWGRHQVDDGIEQREHPKLAPACRAEDRDEVPGADHVFESADDLLVGEG